MNECRQRSSTGDSPGLGELDLKGETAAVLKHKFRGESLQHERFSILDLTLHKPSVVIPHECDAGVDND